LAIANSNRLPLFLELIMILGPMEAPN
jgi:hypothetical protein